MGAINAGELLRESIKDLRSELTDFLRSYQKELVDIWKAISVLETKQKTIAGIYGLLGGAIPAGMVIAWIIIKGTK